MADAVAYAILSDVESLYGHLRLTGVIPDTPEQSGETFFNRLLVSASSDIDDAFTTAGIAISRGDFSVITDLEVAGAFEEKTKQVNVILAIELLQMSTRKVPEGFQSLIDMAHAWLEKIAKGEISIVPAEGDRFGVADETLEPLFTLEGFEVAGNVLEFGGLF